MRTKSCLPVLALVCSLCLQLHAMDRWAALSQIESGDNDLAVGAAGEVSRYQIKPEVWQRYAAPKADWQKASDALAVARSVMAERCAAFERSFKRLPTDFEFYVLWNSPAQVQAPNPVVAERAERFANLVADPGTLTLAAAPPTARPPLR